MLAFAFAVLLTRVALVLVSASGRGIVVRIVVWVTVSAGVGVGSGVAALMWPSEFALAWWLRLSLKKMQVSNEYKRKRRTFDFTCMSHKLEVRTYFECS